MDRERLKQLRNEYTEQHIILKEQFKELCEKFQELLKEHPEQQTEESKRCREALEFYETQKDGMTRQQRRAYERRLAKENKRKH